MKKLAIFGSTGSIGKQALEVVKQLSGIEIAALTTNTNIELLLRQIEEFKPRLVCVTDENACEKISAYIDDEVKLYCGSDGLIDMINDMSADIVLNSVVGSAGLLPTLRAIEKGMDIALANKETLVCGGGLFMEKARENNVRILPVDSEHSAIFQCLQGSKAGEVSKIHLTASGGPFRTWPKEKLDSIKLSDALKHPNWAMGRKITIDSATLMNKGLEMIEAKWLFNVDMEDINVVVHPQSIIHSMVEYRDGSVIAQLGAADMRLPIAYALTYPDRANLEFKKLDFFRLSGLDFETPRYEDFPCLNLAKEAVKIGGNMPACMNAANEGAVELFLNEKIKFTQIPYIIEKAMAAYNYKASVELEDILAADKFGREFAHEVV